MSDTTDPATAPVPRNNGRFAKGNPGGPGRPRGFVVRRPVAPPTIVFVAAPDRGRDDDCWQLDHRRRLAALEEIMRDLERHQAKRRQNGFRRFPAVFVRATRTEKPVNKAFPGSTVFPAV